MEHLQLIIDALDAQITPGTGQDLYDDRIAQVQDELRDAVEQFLADDPATRDLIDRFSETSDVWESVLADALQQSGITEDAEIQRLANELMSLMEPLDPDEPLEPVVFDESDEMEPPSTIPGVLYDEDEMA